MNKSVVKVFYITLDHILHIILIFPKRFGVLINEYKIKLIITNIFIDLTQKNLLVYNYDIDLDQDLSIPQHLVNF